MSESESTTPETPPSECLTVGQLRQLLRGVDDDVEIVAEVEPAQTYRLAVDARAPIDVVVSRAGRAVCIGLGTNSH